MLKNSLNCYLLCLKDFLFKHKIKSNKGCLVDERQTQRSETSQYLQEKKATAIPLVVASETGPAQ